MSYENIDFHTHPFTDAATNVCSHKEYCDMSAENTVSYMKDLVFPKSVVLLSAETLGRR